MTAQDERQSGPEGGPNLALMKSIVIGLGVVILLGLGVIVVTIVNRMAGTSSEAEVAQPAAPAGGDFGAVGIAAPAGTRIAGAVGGQGMVLLTLSGGGEPDRVVVLDAATGRERGRFLLENAAGPGPSGSGR